MSETTHPAIKEFFDMMERRGVETFFLSFRDPDGQGSYYADGGDRYWRIGVLSMQLKHHLDQATRDTEES